MSNDNRDLKELKEISWLLKRPDTFIGTRGKQLKDTFTIVKGKNGKDILNYQKLLFSDGLIKIINEIIDNTVDHKINTHTSYKHLNKPVNIIKINMDEKSGIISVVNNGLGIRGEKSKNIKDKNGNFKYIPEGIYANLRTGSNFDDTGKRYVGGRNGVGATLTTVFSKYLKIITVCNGLRYEQVYTKNLSNNPSLNVGIPKICKVNGVLDFTYVEFLPEYNYFDNSNIKDIIPIIKRRAYDIKFHFKDIKVYFNNLEIQFDNYFDLLGKDIKSVNRYISPIIDHTFPFPKWHVDIFPTDDSKGRTILSFVNGICTVKGGAHVNYITEQIAQRFKVLLPNNIYNVSKKDSENPIKLRIIRKGISMILRCYIPNPSFNGQAKEILNESNLMEKIQFSDSFIRKLLKNGFLSYYKNKCNKEALRLNKNTQGSKKNNVLSKKDYEKANLAGKIPSKCTLIITEGLSASVPIIDARLAIPNGGDYIGVFAVGGKPINPRGKLEMNNLKNYEFTRFRKIMGLNTEKKYSSTAELRYGRIMICTDADYDGSHIKGLIINWIGNYWPELLKIKNFITVFRTHCVRVYNNGKFIKGFYNPEEFDIWKEKNKELYKKYKAKYFKGLGGYTTKDFEDYFRNIKNNEVILTYDEHILKFLDMLFGKDSNKRKKWINSKSDDNLVHAYKNTIMPYTKMLDNDLLLHAKYNIRRMIPHIADGLKLGQRKLIATLLKLGSKIKDKGMKTSTIAGKVEEFFNYHHGEASMQGTISRMAQNFTGSNNINLLKPYGSFGGRNGGYNSFASPRYTSAKLENICKYLFIDDDIKCLKILEDDGVKVEPMFYIPPIPLIVINGQRAGIGSGWSSKVMSHNPIDVINFIRDRIKGVKTFNKINPYYYGFKGSIIDNYDKKTKKNKIGYIIQGCYSYDNKTGILTITELPIDEWLIDYSTLLDEYKSKKIIDDWNHYHSIHKDKRIEKNICYKIKLSNTYIQKASYKARSSFSSEELAKMKEDFEGTVIFYDIVKDFRLRKTFPTTNMNLLTGDGIIKKYKDIYEIIFDFIKLRYDFYGKRKDRIIKDIEIELKILNSKYLYIKCIVDDIFEVKNIPREKHIEYIEKYVENVFKDKDKGYDYLMYMPIISFTPKRLEQLKKQYEDKKITLEKVKKTKLSSMWLKELDLIEAEYIKMIKV